jgi:hypothetical protein
MFCRFMGQRSNHVFWDLGSIGMWENGKFTGRGLGGLLTRAHRHDDAAEDGKVSGDRFSKGEFAVLNFGFRNRQEIEEIATKSTWDKILQRRFPQPLEIAKQVFMFLSGAKSGVLFPSLIATAG